MGRRAGALIPCGTLAVALLAGAACSQNDGQTASDGQIRLSASLTGANEAPTPGEPDGKGTATVTLDQAKGQVCYTITVSNLDSVTAAHIHKGAAGVAGPVAVPLQAPTDGQVDTCAQADSATIQQIAQHPSDYYVNVHDAQFPKGAVRGQLQPSS
jgi:hypothetical protein